MKVSLTPKLRLALFQVSSGINIRLNVHTFKEPVCWDSGKKHEYRYLLYAKGFPCGSVGKDLPAIWETWV